MAWAVIATIGRFDVACVEPQQPRGFVSVEDRHLQVHQHDRIVVRPLRGDPIDRLLSVAGDVDRGAPALEKLGGQLLVDRIVLDHQHPQSREIDRFRSGLGTACAFGSGKLPDQFAQRLGEYRLGQEMPGAKLLRPAVHDFRIVCRNDDRQRNPARSTRLQRLEHALAVQPRHHPIDQQQVVGTPVPLRPLDHRQRRVAIIGLIDAAGNGGADAKRGKQIGKRRACVALIVDHQNPNRHPRGAMAATAARAAWSTGSGP